MITLGFVFEINSAMSGIMSKLNVINLQIQSKVDVGEKTIKDMREFLSSFYGDENIIITESEGYYEVTHVQEDKPFLLFWRE